MPKILLVEDNEMNRDMLSRRLERNGYQVVMAIDGEEGVSMAQTEAPDLILMDLSLPVLNGWAATERIKSNPTTQTIPVIALSAHVMAGSVIERSRPGVMTTTPTGRAARLLKKIEALLAGRTAI